MSFGKNRLRIEWLSPDRGHHRWQDEAAREVLGRRHLLQRWHWGSGEPRATSLLGQARRTAQLAFNRSDIRFYDLRWLDESTRWIADVAARYPGIVAVTAAQVSNLQSKILDNSLGIAVESWDRQVSDYSCTSSSSVHPEPTPVYHLNWPGPPSRAHRRAYRQEASRTVLLVSDSDCGSALHELLEPLSYLPTEVRIVVDRPGLSAPRHYERNAFWTPATRLNVELDHADLVVNLNPGHDSRAYFEQLSTFASGCPSLVLASGWLATLPESATIKILPGPEGREWQRVAEAVGRALASPWEMKQLSDNGREALENQEPGQVFRERIESIAQQSRSLLLRHARSRIARSLNRRGMPDKTRTSVHFMFEATPRGEPPARTPRPRVAHLSPLPPERSGIAGYSALLLKTLSTYGDFDLFSRATASTDDWVANSGLPLLPYAEFLARDARRPYDIVVYQMGNNYDYHHEIAELCLQRPGFVVLHDTYLGHLVSRLYEGRRFEQEVEYAEGTRGERLLAEVRTGLCDPSELLWLPLNRRVVETSQGLIVHSNWDRQELLKSHPDSGAKISVVPLCTPEPTISPTDDRVRERRGLDIAETVFVIATFGFVEENKKVDSIVRNISPFLHAHDDALLVVVGKIHDDRYGKSIRALVRELGLEGKVRLTGFASPPEYEAYLRNCDLCIQFRKDFRGGGSATVNQALAQGLPTLITADGPFLQHPRTAAILVEPDRESELSTLVEELYSRPSERRALGKRAAEYARSTFLPAHCSRAYSQILGLEP